jgi:bifunctional non-homologous end joining protein LigD
MAARFVKNLPEGAEWTYEQKFDGFRALLLKDGRTVRVRSRSNRDLAWMHPSIVAAARRLAAEQAVVDGEIVALDPNGRPCFQALQHRGAYPQHRIAFYAFDLLHLDGADITCRPLLERRARLSRVVDGSGLLLSEQLPGTAAQVVDSVRNLGLEGVIAKRRESLYEAGARSGDWLKLKVENQQEFVIGGYRQGLNGIDALLVGYHDDSGLRFAGKARAGLVPLLRLHLFRKVRTRHVDECPFVDLPSSKPLRSGSGVTAGYMPGIQWVRPDLVAQIRFVEWTDDNHLRRAAFLGLRPDKSARDVHREAAQEITRD